MTIFLKRKEKANDFEREARHVISQKTKRQKLFTYNKEYIKLGFIEYPSDVMKPQYLACYTTVSNIETVVTQYCQIKV